MKLTLLWGARFAFLVALALTSVLSFTSPDQASALDDFIPWDKAEHFIAYYVLAGVGLVAFPRLPTLVLFALLFTQSAIIEAMQPYVGRTRDIYDLVANIAGLLAVVGPLCAYKVRWYCAESSEINLNLAAAPKASGNHGRI
ncbi:MAG: hypothetical protein QNI84_13015 [Henriciella sp.]|nr:hypothetical protein [Henriciella sp.]